MYLLYDELNALESLVGPHEYIQVYDLLRDTQHITLN